jgi:rhodanese-related sulfurtransferase
MTTRTAQSLRDAALIFLAAVLLGLGYNSMSPLGIRPASVLAPTQPQVGNPVPTTAGPARGIQNETLSITILTSPAAVVTQGPSVPNSVTWPQARALLQNGAVLIDARDSDAYDYEHIPGAISIPMNSFEAKIEAFKSSTPASTVIIIYCSSSQCAISRTMAQLMMQKHGFTDVRDMTGGYAEWRLAEYANTASPK